jgi:SAM-dependent methyltransferase
MKSFLEPRALPETSRETLRHYNLNAQAFAEGTRRHDVSQNVAALLRNIEDPPRFVILDLGCGPGRDLITFRDLGHEAVGLDGAEEFVKMARAASGCEVLHQDFLALDLAPGRFHGVFANASLFHVPSQLLPAVLGRLHAALRPRGVLFSSNPRGHNQEGWRASRYGAYHDLESWRGFVSRAGFEEVEHYYRPPGLPRSEQPWLAMVARKSGS